MAAIRPLPDLGDMHAMARLGRLHTLKAARADVLHAMRDTVSRLLAGASSDEVADCARMRELLDRLEEVNRLELTA